MSCPFSSPMRINVIDHVKHDGTKVYRKETVKVPCGKCYQCRTRYAQQWEMRILYENQFADTSYFITFTYNDENLPYYNNEPCFSKDDVQKFFKRLRKKYPIYKIKYLLISEYGDLDQRPHYHAVIFNLPFRSYEETAVVITNIWGKGFCSAGVLAISRIRYLLEYFTKNPFSSDCDFPQANIPFLLSSKRPAIGNCNLDYLIHYIKGNDNLMIPLNGRKYRISDYHLDKLLPKLNKEIINKINQYRSYGQGYSSIEELRYVLYGCTQNIQVLQRRVTETQGFLKQKYIQQVEHYKRLQRQASALLGSAQKNGTQEIQPQLVNHLINKFKKCLI